MIPCSHLSFEYTNGMHIALALIACKHCFIVVGDKKHGYPVDKTKEPRKGR